MNTNYIADLFRYDENTITLTTEEEADHIIAAQAGNENSKLLLLSAYGPALRSTVSRFTSRLPVEERNEEVIEDTRMEAVAAFFDVVTTHDPEKSPRLAGRVVKRLTAALADHAVNDAAMTVPERTLSRFYGILRAADGDIDEARDLAPSMGMTTHTFDDVRAVVRETLSMASGSEDDEGDKMLMHPLHGHTRSEYDEAEDYLMVDVAFRAVDDEEARIVELAYGFRGTEDYAAGEPVPDGAIAGRVGGSRATVQRKRGKALDKMRKALGVDAEG